MKPRNKARQSQATAEQASDYNAVEAVLRRTAIRERRRAFEMVGAVPVFKDGEVLWERADGTICPEPEASLDGTVIFPSGAQRPQLIDP